MRFYRNMIAVSWILNYYESADDKVSLIYRTMPSIHCNWQNRLILSKYIFGICICRNAAKALIAISREKIWSARQQVWLLELVSEALVAKGALLGRVTTGLLGEHAVQEQMDRGYPNITVGEVVMVHEDSLPPEKWLIGQIIDVEVGADGRVRVTVVKTPNGVYKRSICKLALLPIEDCRR